MAIWTTCGGRGEMEGVDFGGCNKDVVEHSLTYSMKQSPS
jgi:hypothetical protein